MRKTDSGRHLNPEEQAIWAKIAASVTPLAGRAQPAAAEVSAGAVKAGGVVGRAVPVMAKATPARAPVPVLDDSWERRIARGTIAPDMAIDLHGHTLDAAHRQLNRSLDRAVASGARVLLVVTGNPRPAAVSASGAKARGAIRAEIGDWLALSGHADAIASVRTAHPRHGGKGALYVILRK